MTTHENAFIAISTVAELIDALNTLAGPAYINVVGAMVDVVKVVKTDLIEKLSYMNPDVEVMATYWTGPRRFEIVMIGWN